MDYLAIFLPRDTDDWREPIDMSTVQGKGHCHCGEHECLC